MSINEWILENLLTDREQVVIVWNGGSIDGITSIYETPIPAFIDMFGTAIQTALDSGTNPIQAINDSDPQNTLGFNDLI